MPADSLFRRENVEQPADTVRRIAVELNVCEPVFSDDEATSQTSTPPARCCGPGIASRTWQTGKDCLPLGRSWPQGAISAGEPHSTISEVRDPQKGASVDDMPRVRGKLYAGIGCRRNA